MNFRLLNFISISISFFIITYCSSKNQPENQIKTDSIIGGFDYLVADTLNEDVVYTKGQAIHMLGTNATYEILIEDAIDQINSGGNFEALQTLKKAESIKDSDSLLYYLKGLAKHGLEDYYGSFDDFDKAITLSINYADAFINRGSLHIHFEEYDKAITDCNRVINIDSERSEAYNNRGLAKYLLGDKTGACKDWSIAGELGEQLAYENIKRYCNE